MRENVDHLIVHCAATPPDRDIGATEIDRWHRAQGWWGCGYHIVIRRDGTVESHEAGNRCRPLTMTGAHVGDCGKGWNARSLGVCLVGGVGEDGRTPEDNFTQAQYDSLCQVIADLRARFPSISTVMGHRDLIAQTGARPKACPSFDVRAWLDQRSTDHSLGLVTVQPGDTLFGIARRLDTSVAKLLTLNPEVTDPGRIAVGAVIRVPG